MHADLFRCLEAIGDRLMGVILVLMKTQDFENIKLTENIAPFIFENTAVNGSGILFMILPVDGSTSCVALSKHGCG
jgi:hypothetical protein